MNFFAADVGGGVGPYLAIYLHTALHWAPGAIGNVLGAMTLATVIAQTPAGAVTDAVRFKRGLLAGCALVIGASALVLATPGLGTAKVVYGTQVTIGIAAAFLAPVIAAITLGMVGPARFTHQTGANQAWNHLGNFSAAAITAVVALTLSAAGAFWVIAVMAMLTAVCVWTIAPSKIDHELARGGVATHSGKRSPSGLSAILEDRRVLVFTVCVGLFHAANAAMLPLVSQKLAGQSDGAHGVAFAAACIITAQLVMVPMAVLCGKKADAWGRKPLFLFAYAVLPVRAWLYTLSADPAYLVSVQILDGLANGIFGVVFLLVIADLTRGTGRFNVVQGMLTTVVGGGAALSTFAGEWLTEWLGYSAAFYALGGTAVVGGLLLLFAMPETRPRDPPLDAKQAG